LNQSAVAAAREAAPSPALGTVERYLTLWMALCIVTGIALGRLFPAPFHALGRAQVARVNLPVAALERIAGQSADG